MVDEPVAESAGADSPVMVNDPEGMWTAKCCGCQQIFDLESLGWIRRGASSWGKRTGIHCPSCGRRRMMTIVHVDRFGRPDQPFSFVLKRVLLIQLVVWGVLATVGAVTLCILWCLGVFSHPA